MNAYFAYISHGCSNPITFMQYAIRVYQDLFVRTCVYVRTDLSLEANFARSRQSFANTHSLGPIAALARSAPHLLYDGSFPPRPKNHRCVCVCVCVCLKPRPSAVKRKEKNQAKNLRRFQTTTCGLRCAASQHQCAVQELTSASTRDGTLKRP
jgi:hypothetical protein